MKELNDLVGDPYVSEEEYKDIRRVAGYRPLELARPHTVKADVQPLRRFGPWLPLTKVEVRREGKIESTKDRAKMFEWKECRSCMRYIRWPHAKCWECREEKA